MIDFSQSRGELIIRTPVTSRAIRAITLIEAIAPLAFDHQGNMDDWLIIDKIEDVVVGTSIPYNYEKSKLAK